MSKMMDIWRPPQIIRPLAIGILRRSDEILAMEVVGDQNLTKGWRPPGGSIEFGERAEEALFRELLEELGEHTNVLRQICVMENIYSHNNSTGHEVVFVFNVEFLDEASYANETYEFEDGGVKNRVVWKKLSDLASGEQTLYPIGLLDFLD